MMNANMFLIIGVMALTVFIVQTIISLVAGHGDADGSDGDTFHADGSHHDVSGHDDSTSFLSYLTFRNLIAFSLGFGWVGYASTRSGLPELVAMLLGILAGLLFSWSIFKMMKLLHGLESDATVNLEDAIGRTAEVYLEIREGSTGKVMIQLGGALQEMPAVCPHPEHLPRGTLVRIIDYEGNLLTVERA